MAEMTPEETQAQLKRITDSIAADRLAWERVLNSRRTRRRVGQVLEEAYPWGYRSEDREP